MALSTCGLCEEETNLINSHYVPAFVFKWLKSTSITGYMRFAETPNKRTQDGIKSPFLCEDCEALFNSFETPFATNIFHPYQENGNQRLGYREWLLKFCVSVSWRTLSLLIKRGSLKDLAKEHMLSVEAAEDTWAKYLRGEIANPREHEQHLLPLDLIDTATTPNLPQNINRYLLRAVEFDFASGERSAYIFTKMGPFALFGFVKKPTEKWLGTKVHLNAGEIKPRRYELPAAVMHYLFDRARNYANIDNQISQKQHLKIEKTLESNLERALSSDQFKAVLRDAEMFGDQAIIRESK